MAENRDIVTLSDVEHILVRPATYLGSMEERTYEEWILDDDKLELKPFVSNDGEVRPDAHRDLARVEKLALKLFDRMKSEVDRVLEEEKEETK